MSTTGMGTPLKSIELRGYCVKLYLHSMEFLGTSWGYFTRDACLSLRSPRIVQRETLGPHGNTT